MKEDVRIKKTKRDLRNGLVALLKEMPFEKITVCNICEKAEINRMTFYKHFMDKSDLLEDLLNETKKQLVFSDKEFDGIKFGQNPKKYIEDSIEYFALACGRNKDVITALRIYDAKAFEEIITRSAHDFASFAVSAYGVEKVCKYDAFAEFMANGVCGSVLSMTLNGEMEEKDINSLKKLVAEIFTSNLIFG